MPVTILHGADIWPGQGTNQVLSPGWLAIEAGRIIEVAAGDPPRQGTGATDDRVDLSGHAILPGLVNAHAHSPMILYRGRAEQHSLLTLDGWWQAIREPELHLAAADITPAATIAYAEMIASGTTLVADQYFFADEVMSAANTAGLRAVIAYGIVELDDEAAGKRELARARAFVQQTVDAGNPRITGWIGPHAPFVDNSDALLREEVESARAFGAGLHLHMAVGPEDNAPTLAARGVTAAVALERLGFFRARVLAAHCLDLAPDDIAVFARAPAAAVVQCATAGLRSGRPGIAAVRDLQAAGVTVALGTDNMAANNSHDLFTEMKIAGLAAAHREGVAGALPAATLLRMATLDGAKALGLDAVTGSLAAGKAADLIAVDLRGLGYTPSPDLATLLVYSGSGRDVTRVMVDGEWLMRDRRLTRLDPGKLRRNFATTYQTYWARVASTRAER